MEDIFGDERAVGDNLELATESLRVLMGFWNDLGHRAALGNVHLSTVVVSDPPSQSELIGLAARRANEIRWFWKGLEAGDDLDDLGEHGERLLVHLEQFSDLVVRMLDELACSPHASASDLHTARGTLDALTRRVEEVIVEVLALSSAARAEAIEEFGHAA